MPDTADTQAFDAIIVGAGFSGLYQLHVLRDRLGLAVRVLEAADGIGGTWYWNRYPGARCDSESYYYSYSFSHELEQEWEWTERYPEQPEIMRYLNHVADRFDLRRDIQLGAKVTSARFDAAAGRWLVQTAAGERFSAQFLITAVGCLSTANIPAIPGRDSFAGISAHTGHWPHGGADFAGKRVGLIGTGSTGIQAAPVIAAAAAHLTVFQRTANYSVPARNGPMDAAQQREIKANYAEIRRKSRESSNGHPFDFSPLGALDVPPEERQARYQAAWDRGGLRFRAVFKDILTSKEANDTASEFIRAKIREIVHDPAVAAMLTPTDHPFAAKRPPIDTAYFETFNRANVTLVDLKATPIQEITPAGVRTSVAEYPLDIIVYATGFDAMTGPLLALDITGEGGLTLREHWAAGPRTYLGLQTPGFPNLFTITGPGSPSVLTNMPTAIEQHADWIAGCIAHMRANGLRRVAATPDATEAWVAHVNEAAAATLLPMASSSWYLGANVPGKPRVFMPYAGGMARYAAHCAQVAAEGYRGFAFA
jgi:cation diffusion facilitator CzcD-associated flavoprotein CzcO